MKSRFLLSTLSEFPHLKDAQGNFFPEIALAGRSNVGKSSLINHLLQRKNLAKISSTQGKTQLLNFFVVDERFLLADLPGYGFAKAPLEAIEKWSRAIDSYLNNRPTLRLILLLADSRRELCEKDRDLMHWAQERQIPLALIFTKTDKLTRNEVENLVRTYPDAIPYSVKNPDSRRLVEKKIGSLIWD